MHYQMVYAQTRIRPGDETYENLWDFEIQTDHLIQAKRPDQVVPKNKNKNIQTKQNKTTSHPSKNNKNQRLCHLVNFAVYHWVKIKENEKIDKYLDFTREAVEYEGYDDTNCTLRAQNGFQEPEDDAGGLRNQWEYRIHPDYCIAEIG